MDESFAVCGRTFSVVTLGCRTNHYEAEALVSMLEARGAVYFASGRSADILIVVTCSITSVADAKTRKMLRRLRRLNPEALIVACGCYVQASVEEDAWALGVDILVGNRLKREIPDAIERWYADGVRASFINREIGRDLSWDRLTLACPRIYTRAFIKIQDGCSRGCSYCIVPSVRGRQVSRDPDDVLGEIRRVVASGCSEVILTGIHLGAYRHADVSLSKLIARISQVPGLLRLRLGSIEPFAVGRELLEVLADSPVFCRHLHLPLQSGSDEVLKRMRRGYDADAFARMADEVRAVLGDDVHLSTDLIVGFPGERAADFAASLALIEKLSFGRVHVFPFSARAGTDAASFGDAVPREMARARVVEAMALSEKLLVQYAERMKGKDDVILVENVENNLASGWSRAYLKVYARLGEDNMVGKLLPVSPKTQVRGILLCDEVDPEQVEYDFED